MTKEEANLQRVRRIAYAAGLMASHYGRAEAERRAE